MDPLVKPVWSAEFNQWRRFEKERSGWEKNLDLLDTSLPASTGELLRLLNLNSPEQDNWTRRPEIHVSGADFV